MISIAFYRFSFFKKKHKGRCILNKFQVTVAKKVEISYDSYG